MPSSCARNIGLRGIILALLVLCAAASAQTCLTHEDLDANTLNALQAAGRKFYDMTAKADTAGMQANAIPSVASDFGGIVEAVKESQPSLASAAMTLRPPFVLKAEGTERIARAEFLCGVFGKTGQTAESAVFTIPNLPPGEYAVVIADAAGEIPFTVSFVLQKEGTDWKLGGFYAKPSQVVGHNGDWFLDRAREFKAKGKTRDAWLYYMQARDLFAPVPFMSTMVTDKIYDESQGLQPTDLPAGGNSVDLVVSGKTYKLTAMYPVSVGDDLDLVVKYATASVANTAQAYQENVVVIKALLAKFPELRDGFQGMVARATEPSGKDYGTLMAMKDVP